MDPLRRVRKPRITSASQRACVECQKRKTRCIIDPNEGGTESCVYCNKVGKRCIFEGPPDRTSLTRKNLDAAEWRCKQLESLLHSLNPDMDIEDAIKSESGGSNVVPESRITRSSTASDEFEWHEGTPGTPGVSKSDDVTGDGMAILPSKAQEAGYLGKSSLSHNRPERGQRFFNPGPEAPVIAVVESIDPVSRLA